jgi:predicted HD phosphohydrolase
MSVIVEKILALYESRGGAAYSWDRVSQMVHALQTATQALQAGASDALVIAALLHGVGHLLTDREAVMLRKWDKAAKVPSLEVPDLARYRPLLERCLRADRA